MGCYIWHSEDRTGRGRSLPRHLYFLIIIIIIIIIYYPSLYDLRAITVVQRVTLCGCVGLSACPPKMARSTSTTAPVLLLIFLTLKGQRSRSSTRKSRKFRNFFGCYSAALQIFLFHLIIFAQGYVNCMDWFSWRYLNYVHLLLCLQLTCCHWHIIVCILSSLAHPYILARCPLCTDVLSIVTSANAEVMRSSRSVCHSFVVPVILSVRACAGLLRK